MKTVNIITHYIGGTGGVQVYNETLANVLAKQGYKVRIIGLAKQEKASKSKFSDENHENIEFIALNEEDIFFKKPHLFFKDMMTKRVNNILLKYIQENDIIIVSNPICMPFIAQLTNWKKYHIIAQFHGSVQLAMEGKGMYKIYRYLINRYYHNVTKFLVLTNEDANVLKEMYGFNNVDFLLNPSRFSFDSVQTDVKESKQIIFLGRLDKIKQIDHIIEAYSKSKLHTEGYSLNIYGDGPEYSVLNNYINQNKICGVTLKGRTADVKGVLKESALIVMASKSEGLPLNLIESLSVGLPILSYDTSAGIREVVEDGYNGYLVNINDIDELANKMNVMVNDKDDLQRLAINSYQLSEKFSERVFGERLKKFL